MKRYLVLMLLAVLASSFGCAATIKGEAFLRLKSGATIYCSAMELFVIHEADFPKWIDKQREARESLQSRLAEGRVTHGKAKAAEASAWDAYQSSLSDQQATGEKRERLARAWQAATIEVGVAQAAIQRIADQLATMDPMTTLPKPIITVTTNSHGEFSFEAPDREGLYLIASFERVVGEKAESTFWVVPVPMADGELSLNNTNTRDLLHVFLEPPQ